MIHESSSRSPFSLLKNRHFAPLFVAQLLGVFNDRLFKNALLVLLSFPAASWTTIAPERLAILAAGIYYLPVFLFSASAGQLADRFDKAWLARLAKGLEMLIMGVAALGYSTHSLAVLLGALFLLGLHSALFAPVVYAILPQHLRDDELLGGNALVAAGTFLAIVLGTLAGALLAGQGGDPTWVALAGLLLATAGFVASCRIPPAPAPAPEPGLRINLNPLSESWRTIAFARRNRRVFLAILGISWFWLYGAVLLAHIPAYASSVLGGDESLATLLLAVFAVGIGVGSLLCDRFSGKFLEIGLVAFAVIGLTLFGLDLAMASPSLAPAGAPLALHSNWRGVLDVFALGVFGGLFVVPLYVLMQLHSEPSHRARIIAANTILNALFMVVGSLGAAVLIGNGVTMAQLFGIAALGHACVAIFIYRRTSAYFLRFLAGLLIHSLYRIDKSGLDNIPDQGPAVLVCNHVSFIDPVVIMAVVRRPIRFVMDHRIHRAPVIGFIFRHSRTIPIAPAKEDPLMKEAAFAEVARALAAGELVGLFPEGAITRTGELNQFRYGVGRIVAETPVPVVPMALRGLWGSFFSRRYGRAMSKPSVLRPFSKIGLVADRPVAPEDVTPESLRVRVTELRGDLW